MGDVSEPRVTRSATRGRNQRGVSWPPSSQAPSRLHGCGRIASGCWPRPSGSAAARDGRPRHLPGSVPRIPGARRLLRPRHADGFAALPEALRAHSNTSAMSQQNTGFIVLRASASSTGLCARKWRTIVECGGNSRERRLLRGSNGDRCAESPREAVGPSGAHHTHR